MGYASGPGKTETGMRTYSAGSTNGLAGFLLPMSAEVEGWNAAIGFCLSGATVQEGSRAVRPRIGRGALVASRDMKRIWEAMELLAFGAASRPRIDYVRSV